MKKDQKTDFLSARVRYIPINDIRPNPQQPRRRFDSESLQELAASIAAYGILQPITVRQQGAVYELVAGERRWRAARIAGLRQVPCLLARVDEEDAALLALIENLQRRDLDYMEEASAIARLLRRYGLSQQQAAEKLGRSQSAVANKLRLLQFSEEVREAILEAGLTERHARALLNLNEQGDELLLEAIRTISAKEMNVSQTEKYIAQLQGKEEKPKEKRLFVVKDLRIFINTIDKALETMKLSGIQAQTQMQEEEDELVYTIRIPKESAYGKDKQ